VHLPVDVLAAAGLMVDAGDAQGRGQGVRLFDLRDCRLFGCEHDDDDTQDGRAEQHLDDIGWQGQAYHGADNGHGGGDEGHRDSKA